MSEHRSSHRPRGRSSCRTQGRESFHDKGSPISRGWVLGCLQRGSRPSHTAGRCVFSLPSQSLNASKSRIATDQWQTADSFQTECQRVQGGHSVQFALSPQSPRRRCNHQGSPGAFHTKTSVTKPAAGCRNRPPCPQGCRMESPSRSYLPKNSGTGDPRPSESCWLSKPSVLLNREREILSSASLCWFSLRSGVFGGAEH